MRKLRSLAVLAAGLTAMLCGCSSSGRPEGEPPSTYKVEGIVLRKDGQPFVDGLINFRNLKNPDFPANGRIGSDGRFALQTLAGSNTLPGATEGDHEVMILPGGTSQDVKPIILSKTFKVEAKNNELTIKLEK